MYFLESKLKNGNDKDIENIYQYNHLIFTYELLPIGIIIN